MRQIVLDTETTGLEVSQGHRVIEIGAVEMINRRLTGNNFRRHLNPQREIDEAAIEVHGITNERLQNEPLFGDIAAEFMGYLEGAQLIIHNAPFDVGFLNNEFNLAGYGDKVIDENDEDRVLDTLKDARRKHPGQNNSLDALCRRYAVDNSRRTLHGALLDAEILADVYLQMTGGQISLIGGTEDTGMRSSRGAEEKIPLPDVDSLPVIRATAAEAGEHAKWLALLRRKSGGAVWDLSLIHI